MFSQCYLNAKLWPSANLGLRFKESSVTLRVITFGRSYLVRGSDEIMFSLIILVQMSYTKGQFWRLRPRFFNEMGDPDVACNRDVSVWKKNLIYTN